MKQAVQVLNISHRVSLATMNHSKNFLAALSFLLPLAPIPASAATYAINAVIDLDADSALFSGGGRVQNEWNTSIDFGAAPIPIAAGDTLTFQILFAGGKGLYLADTNDGLGTQTLNLWFSTGGPIGSGFIDHFSRGEYSLVSATGDIDAGPVPFTSASGPAFVSPNVYQRNLTDEGFAFGGITGFLTVESLQIAWGDGLLTGVAFELESDLIRIQTLTPTDPTVVPLPGGLVLMGSALALIGTGLRRRRSPEVSGR